MNEGCHGKRGGVGRPEDGGLEAEPTGNLRPGNSRRRRNSGGDMGMPQRRLIDSATNQSLAGTPLFHRFCYYPSFSLPFLPGPAPRVIPSLSPSLSVYPSFFSSNPPSLPQGFLSVFSSSPSTDTPPPRRYLTTLIVSTTRRQRRGLHPFYRKHAVVRISFA